MKKVSVLLIIGILLLMPLISIITIEPVSELENIKPVKKNGLSYVDHPKFTVDGNGDFSTYFNGFGTADQPYTFEGQNITSSDTLINITNTDAYCVIKDCFFDTAIDEILTADAILLDNASHVTIEGCTFYNVSKIVLAYDSANLTIIDAVSDDTRAADIYLTNCPYANLTGNTIEGAFWTGNPYIKLTDCNNSHIVGNNVTWSYIQIINSNETQIKGNTLFKTSIYVSRCVDLLAEYNTIDADDSVDPIGIYSSYQCNISHNTIKNQQVDGISVGYSAEIIVRNNTITSPGFGPLNNEYGIYVEASVDCLIENNTASTRFGIGIGIEDSNNTLVYDNIAFHNERGFYDRGTLDTHFNNCLAYENAEPGYYVWESNRTQIDYCNATSNEQRGFYISECYDSEITYCFAITNEYEGYLIAFGNSNFFWDCSAVNNSREGFLIQYEVSTDLYYCQADGNNYEQFQMDYSDYCELRYCSASGGYVGFELYDSDSCVLNQSTASFANDAGFYLWNLYNSTLYDCNGIWNDDYGIQIYGSTDVFVNESVFTNNYYHGIYVEDSESVVLYGNEVEGIQRGDIRLEDSTLCVLIDNTLTKKGLEVLGSAFSHYNHTIPSSNLVATKPIRYLLNETSLTYDVHEDAQVFLIGCIDTTISSGGFENVSVGARVVFSENCTIEKLDITECDVGVDMFQSENCTIVNGLFSVTDSNYGQFGIFAEYSPRINITNCWFSGMFDGVSIEYSPNSLTYLNDFYDMAGTALEVSDSPNSLIQDNAFHSIEQGAIEVMWSDDTIVYKNNLIDYISGGGIDLYQSDNVVITHNNISSLVEIRNSVHTILENNTLHQSRMQFRYSEDSEIYNNTFIEGGLYFQSEAAQYWNHTVIDNTVNGLPLGFLDGVNNLDIDASTYGQLILMNSENVTVSGFDGTGDFVPLHLYSCKNVNVSDYYLENVYSGLKIFYSEFCNIENFTVDIAESNGIHIVYSPNITLSNCQVSFDGYYGIYVYQSSDCVISDANVWNSTNTGFKIEYSDSCIVDNFIGYYCPTAMYLQGSDSCNVTNSGFFNNTRGLLVSSSSTNNLFYLNEFGGNSEQNAMDNVAGNWWDNGTVGNAWDDYIGSGTYAVYGTGGGIDNYPSGFTGHSIVISSPDNQTIYESTTGNVITWTSSSNYIVTWEVWAKNSTDTDDQWVLQATGQWTGDPVIHSFDGFEPGEYDFAVLLRSIFGTWNYDIVGITIIEVVPPEVVPVDDIEFWTSSPVESITWDVSDSDPKNYTIYINGTVDSSGPWDGSDIFIGLGDLPAGVHNITLVVYDESDEWATDTVMVTIRTSTIPSIDHPDDIEFGEWTDGNEVTWTVSDTYPDFYEIYVNGTLETTIWDGSDVTYDLDSLSVGVHNITLVVYSECGEYSSDTIFVTILAISTPIIDSPDDIEFEEGSEGYNVTWTVSDVYPNYFEIYINGALNATLNWDGSDILFILDGLPAGTYNITLVLYSESGPSASDSIEVVVTQASTSTTTTTETSTTTTDTSTSLTNTTPSSTEPGIVDPAILIMGIGGACGVGVILILLLLKKRKGT